jgi:gliding motility-associated-like protein
MHKAIVMLLLVFVITANAQHVPIAVTGFNEDVIAEGTGNSALTTTTREMDAFTPSNFVMCTQQFANANGFTPSGTYGLPDNGAFSSGGRSYQLGNYSTNNALYLLTTEAGLLTLTTPTNFSSISIVGVGTEGVATISIVFNFSDGTTLNPGNQSYEDWFNGTTGVVLQGFGRVKRMTGPFTTTQYNGAPTNPRFYSREFSLPCDKTLTSISFSNVSASTVTQSNRAFILAVSGVQSIPPPVPAANGTTLCPNNSTTLNVISPVAGVTYSWFNVASGGVALASGTSFTTPSLTSTTTYYLQATNSCTSTPRTAVIVNVTPVPTNPTVNTTATLCSGATPTLSVQTPIAGLTYKWYSTCPSGAVLNTGTNFTTPALTATTTYYVNATNSCNSTSNCTAVTINIAPAITTPAASATSVCPNTSGTLTVQSPVAGNTYTWYTSASGGVPVATGTTFSTPSLSTTTTYYLQAQDACYTSTRTAIVVTVIPPLAAPVVNNVSACTGSTVALNVQSPVSGATYKWYNAATGGSLVFTGQPLTVITPFAAVTYYVEASDACSVSARTAVTITPTATTVPIVNPVTICAANTATLTIQNPLAGETYRWYTTATGGTSLTTAASYTTPVLSATTTYYVEAVNSILCTGSVRTAVTVTVIQPLATPVVTISNVTISSILFSWSAITGASSYEVSMDNGSSWTTPSSGATGLTHQLNGLAQNQPVCIKVRAVRTPACAVSSAATLCGKTLSTEIFIPNTFTPNNDGKNDVFYVYSNGIQSMHLMVFNQWGEKIFESQNINSGWDGKYKGVMQPNGTYVYALKATLSDGTTVTRSGSISIVR